MRRQFYYCSHSSVKALLTGCQEFFRQFDINDFSCVSRLFSTGINECSEKPSFVEVRYKQKAIFLFYSPKYIFSEHIVLSFPLLWVIFVSIFVIMGDNVILKTRIIHILFLPFISLTTFAYCQSFVCFSNGSRWILMKTDSHLLKRFSQKKCCDIWLHTLAVNQPLTVLNFHKVY